MTDRLPAAQQMALQGYEASKRAEEGAFLKVASALFAALAGFDALATTGDPEFGGGLLAIAGSIGAHLLGLWAATRSHRAGLKYRSTDAKWAVNFDKAAAALSLAANLLLATGLSLIAWGLR